MGFDDITCVPLPTHPLLVPSLCLVVEDLFWYIPVFFINGYSEDSCDFSVLKRGRELRVFLLCYLGCSSHTVL